MTCFYFCPSTFSPLKIQIVYCKLQFPIYLRRYKNKKVFFLTGMRRRDIFGRLRLRLRLRLQLRAKCTGSCSGSDAEVHI